MKNFQNKLTTEINTLIYLSMDGIFTQIKINMGKCENKTASYA